MSIPLVFQAGVRKDVDEAYEWYENQRDKLGEAFLSEVQSVLDRIVRNPELHAPIHKDVRHSRLKRFPYAVYYKIETERIVVIAIHHSKRNPKFWQSRI